MPVKKRPGISERIKARKDRDFPFRDGRGQWRHPKTHKVITKSTAKGIQRRAERRIAFANLSRVSGRDISEVRKKFKGIPTNDIVGKWGFVKTLKDGTKKQFRGHWITKRVRDKRTGKMRTSRRFIEDGQSKRVLGIFRAWGIVIDSGQLLQY